MKFLWLKFDKIEPNLIKFLKTISDTSKYKIFISQIDKIEQNLIKFLKTIFASGYIEI